MSVLLRACAAMWLCLPVLLIASQSRAEVLVDFTFGDSAGTATNLPQSVAGNLSATPMVGKTVTTGVVVAHSFVEWAPGDMAMHMTNADAPTGGGRMFQFTLQADPGFTFQLTDALFTWRASNTYGNNRDISVRPNADPSVGFLNLGGGDFMSTFGPAYPGWYMPNWNSFTPRTDLTSLVVAVSLTTSGGPYNTDLNRVQISGNVLPEPATTSLMAIGLLALLRRHRVVSRFVSARLASPARD